MFVTLYAPLVASLILSTSEAGAFVSPSSRTEQRSIQLDASTRSVESRTFQPSRTSNTANNALADTTNLGSLTIPSIGIGTISWSSDTPFGLESNELQTVVDKAYRSNGAFFDTAERYGSHLKTAFGMGWGETESLTAKMLRRTRDNNDHIEHTPLSPVVATKFTPSPWRNTAQSVVDACEESRQRLGVDQIDLYQLHMPDIVQPLKFLGRSEVKDELYWDGLAECYHRGLVKNVGVSNYGPTLLMRCQDALGKRGVPLASNQIGYSLIGRHNGAQETVDKCKELDIAVLGFFPFAMGLLTGKYSASLGPGSIDYKSRERSLLKSKKTGLESMELNRYAEGITPLMDVMTSIAERRGKTVAQIALNYVVCKGVIPIPGANSYSQVSDNIGAMGWRLSPTEVEMLETAADSLGFGFEGAGFKRTSEKFVGYGVEKWSLN